MNTTHTHGILSRAAKWAALTVMLASLVLSGCGTPTTAPDPTATPGTDASTSPTTETASDEPQYGGIMTIAYNDDLATLDPAIGYDWTNWPAEKMLYDALLDYDDTTNLVPQLAAEMPVINEDATEYTFTLRQGVKFHNGRELVASDVEYSITRVLDPATMSPGAGFYTGILGAEAFMAGEADSVSGIEVIDTYTIKFTLVSSDVTFLNKMALNFAFIVPQEAVDEWGDEFGHHPVGTGPFVFKSWNSGQQIEFEKNADYFIEELPYLDGVIIQVGVTPDVQILRLEGGEIDMMGDPIPAADYVSILQDPEWEGQLVQAPQVSTIYIAINTQMAPFDDVRVRQALNYAINKDRIVTLLNGRVRAANQILPPEMPGYDDTFTGYEYDPEKARELLAEAGYPDGFSTVIECVAIDPEPKICESFQQDLAEVGIELEIKQVAASTVIEDGGTPNTAPLVWSGGLAWIQDYPDPDDFYAPILGCDAAVVGGWNWSWYCNTELHDRAISALGILDSETRMAEYTNIFGELMDDAVWVPVYNGTYNILHSESLSGEVSDFAHMEHTIRYERLWKSQ